MSSFMSNVGVKLWHRPPEDLLICQHICVLEFFICVLTLILCGETNNHKNFEKVNKVTLNKNHCSCNVGT